MIRYLFIISVFILNSLCASSQKFSVVKFEDDQTIIAQMDLAICENQFQKMENDFNELYLKQEPNHQKKEECDNDYKPVTGNNNRCYLNKFWAKKNNVRVKHQGYDSSNFVYNDFYTWPIERVCIPLYKEKPVIKDLNDGTFYYKIEDKEFRGTQNNCKCLPEFAKVSCPRGEVNINELNTGDTVWTKNKDGKKIAMPVLIANKVAVSDAHLMVHIDLADGRNIQVTAGHPSSVNDKIMGDFEIGDYCDGSIIVNKYEMIYSEKFTYDILPEGETGFYWINGILLGSTLYNYNSLVNNINCGKNK